MKKLLLLFLLFSSMALTAQEELNRTWFLTELTVAGEDIFIPNEENQDGYPTLSILISDTESAVEGIGICNDFTSDDIMDVTATETIITFNISHTLVFCETSEEIAFETAYFNFLGTPDSQEFSYSVNDDFLENTELILTNSNGDVAIYSTINQNPPSDLTQEDWYLDFFEIDGVAQNPPSEEGQLNDFAISNFNINMIEQGYLCFYDGTGAFSAFSYFGTSTISISYLGLLAMDCGVPVLNQYDQIFTTQLQGKTFSYELIEDGEGRELILTDQNGDRIFYTNAFLNTDSFDTPADISVSPNPAKDFIKISGSSIDKINSYSIINLNGKVLRQNHFETTINVNTLPQGLYFLVLTQGQNRIVKRFIKN